VPGWYPGVSILKPVRGTSPELYACLRSFCEQDWPEYEVIFGVHTHDDPAIEVVERLIAELPHRNLRLVVDDRLSGPNRKASNLANICRVARHDLLILADSDVRVDRNCIAAMAAPFADKSAGAVTCVYKGLPVDDPVASFGAMHVNDWMLPSILVDVDLRGIDFVFGALCAVRRQALDQIGGFEHLAQGIAEDFAMGWLVARNGWEVVLSPYACDTIVSDQKLATLLRREVRWQRAERACRPLDHFLSMITYPLPLLLVLLLPRPTLVGLTVIAAEIASRIALHYQLRRGLLITTPPQPWLVPLRECVCFLVWAASLVGDRIGWGNYAISISTFRGWMASGGAPPAPARIPDSVVSPAAETISLGRTGWRT